MTWRRTVGRVGGAVLLAVASACGSGATAATGTGQLERAALVPTTATPTTEAPTTTAMPTTTAPPAPPSTEPPPATTAPPATAPHPARVVVPQPWVPYAIAGPVTLHHPSDHTEAVGFHQSGHDGAQQQDPTPTAVRWFTQRDRGRDTTPRGAADLVVEPDRALRVPVTGTVIRAGTYTLYCDHVDQYAVIEPDARPGWEVKVLHIEGLVLARGQRVEAGVTPLAAKARVLPFPSTVEDDTGSPAWPHVHIEVVDPDVPDRPTGPGCP